jgi:DNA polymerase-1
MIYYITKQSTIPDGSSSITYLNNTELLHSWLQKNSVIGCDTETEGFDPFTCKLMSLQLGNKYDQFVINCYEFDIAEFKEYFEDKTKTFIFHNAKFDLRFLYHKGIIPKIVKCTFLGEVVQKTGLIPVAGEKALDSVVFKYCGAVLDKGVRGKIHYKGLDTEVIIYAAKDVEYLEDVLNAQMKILEEKELVKVFKLESTFTKVLAYIEYSGIKLNAEEWKKKCKKDLIDLKVQENILSNYIIDNKMSKYIDIQLDLFNQDLSCKINWSSSQQVVELFKDLGIDTLTEDKKTGKKKYSVDAKVITPQKDNFPIIPLYLKYKGLEKTTSTYGNNWLKHINKESGRIHSNFMQVIDTGRMSSGGKNKATKEEYINFLNIPQDNAVRNCIIPEKGKVFIDCDYSGQETVILANYSGEPNMINLIETGGDMHSFVAKAIYPEIADCSDDEVKTKHKDKRQTAKAAGFAVQYGGNGYTIANNLSISPEEGDKVYESYFKAFPELKKYFTKVYEDTIKNGCIITDKVIGRKIYLPQLEKFYALNKEVNNDDFWSSYRIKKQNNTLDPNTRNKVRDWAKTKSEIGRMSQNYPIQGSGALMMKIAAIYIFDIIVETNNFKTVLFPNLIYDQTILEVPEEDKDYWAKVVQDSMEKGAAIFCKNPYIKAEPEILTKWKK